jgi:hypothetical protein
MRRVVRNPSYLTCERERERERERESRKRDRRERERARAKRDSGRASTHPQGDFLGRW